jgi:hypothetical protein
MHFMLGGTHSGARHREVNIVLKRAEKLNFPGCYQFCGRKMGLVIIRGFCV